MRFAELTMDPASSFGGRLTSTLPFLTVWFVVGFVIALLLPGPLLILTVSVGISFGMIVLGPYAAAALYALKLQRLAGGHLRLPVCVLLAASTVFITRSLHFMELSGVCSSVGRSDFRGRSRPRWRPGSSRTEGIRSRESGLGHDGCISSGNRPFRTGWLL